MIRLLTYTNLFPNRIQPRHGIFVAERLRQQRASGRVQGSVVAPVPWFPSGNPRFGRYAELARVPRAEERDGVAVEYPRYVSIPRIGMSVAPLLMAAGTRHVVRRAAARADFIDAHFLYPDGVAAVILGRQLGLPVLLTARGSDVNQFGEFAVPRRWLRWALGQARHVFTVSSALRARLLQLGAEPARVTVSRNGVDLQRFRPIDRASARAELGWPAEARLLLSVGNLLELKGHHLLIDALADLPDYRLYIAGDGPRRQLLLERIAQLGLSGRVQLLGLVDQSRLACLYSAADLTLLASSREGLPNVVLESLACGTPVVATPVGGVPEVIDSPEAGRLVEDRSPGSFVEAIRQYFESPVPPDRVRVHAQRFGWASTIATQLDLMERLLATPAGSAAGDEAR